MMLLAYAGCPPALAIWLTVWMNQMKIAWVIVAMRHLQMLQQEEHSKLSPGEQYRKVLQRGGYRP